MRNIWVGRCWKPPKQTETRIFYLYWSNFAYFIHSWGLLSYDSIIFWTSSTLMQSLSKMLCRIFIKSSRVSGLTTSVCSIAVLKRRVFFSLSGISLQLKLQVVKTFYFAQSFSFYRPAPQIFGGGAGDGLYHYGKWWTPTSNSPIEILNILSLESYRNTGLYFHHTYFIEVNFMFLYVLTKISVNLTL